MDYSWSAFIFYARIMPREKNNSIYLYIYTFFLVLCDIFFQEINCQKCTAKCIRDHFRIVISAASSFVKKSSVTSFCSVEIGTGEVCLPDIWSGHRAMKPNDALTNLYMTSFQERKPGTASRRKIQSIASMGFLPKFISHWKKLKRFSENHPQSTKWHRW